MAKVRQVYSTDPDPEEPAETAATPHDPAGPWEVQGDRPVLVRVERKGRGGKTVTVIRGVQSPAAGRRALLRHLKSRLGTGGTVKGDQIEIQGDQRERILLLLEELGFRARQG